MKESIAWLGLDAHAKFSVLGWIDDAGQRRQHWRFPTCERELIRHLQKVPATIKHLALEECGISRWLAQVARPHVDQLIVSDPKENYRISRHHHKCDEEDGYSLAHLFGWEHSRRFGSRRAMSGRCSNARCKPTWTACNDRVR